MTILKINVIASYASQIYVAAIGILLVPYYLRFMGAEAYGLIGFYSMLQAWFMLLDMGLTPTMIRETARYRGGSIDALTLRRFTRTLEGFFVIVAVLGATVVIASSNFISRSWLKVQSLPLNEVRNVIILIAFIIALRWVSGLYKGTVTGFERLVWLGGFSIVVATLRFVLVIPIFIYIGVAPTVFFSYQLFVAIFELAVLAIYTHLLLPKLKSSRRAPWEWGPLKGVLRFSLTIAFTSSVWIVVTQTDKLLLSKFLPLSQYAYFTLSVLLASGVTLLSGPIGGALLPRMVKLQAEGDEKEMIRMYRNATQMVAVIAIPASLVLAFFSYRILLVWTGSLAIAQSAAPVLTLYALGNGMLAICSFPYYLQFAKGDLKLHLIGSVLFVTALIPSIIWGTIHYGVIGAGYAWFCSNALYLAVWVPIIHRRFVRGLHRTWLLQDLAAIVMLTLTCALIMHQLVRWPDNRGRLALLIGALGAILIVIAAAASSWVRQAIVRQGVLAFGFLSNRAGESDMS